MNCRWNTCSVLVVKLNHLELHNVFLWNLKKAFSVLRFLCLTAIVYLLLLGVLLCSSLHNSQFIAIVDNLQTENNSKYIQLREQFYNLPL